MSRANINQLVSKLRVKVKPKHLQFSQPGGPFGRLKLMRSSVTALVRHERIELHYYRAFESRQYAERLISEAIRYGDCHRPTMNLAKFWITDPALIPKLFQVLVPRFKDWPSGLSYTRMLRAPSNIKDHWNDHEDYQYQKAVLELRGNPYPSLSGPVQKTSASLIHNVLLEEARKDYMRSQPEISLKSVENKKSEDIKSVAVADFISAVLNRKF